MKLVLATVVLYIAKTYALKPQPSIIPPIKPGIPDSYKAINTFFLYVINKNILTKTTKKNCLQNKICHSDAPSKDLTNKPPKLKQNAPKKTNKGPGIFEIKFI